MTTKKPSLTTIGYCRTELTFHMPDDMLYTISGKLETPEQKALFHKLAAVDDLVEALENFLGFMDSPIARLKYKGDEFYAEMIDCGRAALAKARGEA